jgi:hypothetical protein
LNKEFYVGLQTCWAAWFRKKESGELYCKRRAVIGVSATCQRQLFIAYLPRNKQLRSQSKHDRIKPTPMTRLKTISSFRLDSESFGFRFFEKRPKALFFTSAAAELNFSYIFESILIWR